MAELNVAIRRVERIEYDEVEDVVLTLSRKEAEGIQTLLWYGVAGNVLRDLDLDSLLDVLNTDFEEPDGATPFSSIVRAKNATDGYTS